MLSGCLTLRKAGAGGVVISMSGKAASFSFPCMRRGLDAMLAECV